MRRIVWPLLLLVACANPADDDPDPRDAGPARDAGTRDSGPRDGGDVVGDAGDRDGGSRDAGDDRDGGSRDAGERVVIIEVAYSAAADEPSLAHLYLTESSTTRTQLTPTLAGGPVFGGKGDPIIAGVDGFDWTVDGSSIVYAAQQDTFDFYELYVVSDFASPSRSKLSLSVADGETRDWEFSPDGSLLSFRQQGPGDIISQRHIVRPEVGQQSTQISVGSGGTTAWSPVALQVVFQDIIVSASDRDLWHVDLNVTPPVRTRVNPGANNGFGGSASWSADGSQIAYGADETALRLFELWRVGVNGATLGARERLTLPFPANADVGEVGYAPAGTMLAFLANTETTSIKDLFVLDSSGTAPITPIKLTGAFPAGARGVLEFTWNDAGTRIAYAADHQVARTYSVYVTDTNGANAVQVSGDNAASARFIHNDTMLLFAQEIDGEGHAFSLDVSTTPFGAPVDLGPISSPTPFDRFALSPSQNYLVQPTRGDPQYLIVSNLTGTPTTSVTLETIPDDFSFDRLWCWSPNDELVIIGPDGALYLVEDLTSPELFRISGPITKGGRVTGCQFPPSVVD